MPNQISARIQNLEDGHGLSYMDPGDLPERPPLHEGYMDPRSGRTYGIELEVSRITSCTAGQILGTWRRENPGAQSKSWNHCSDSSIPFFGRELKSAPSRSLQGLQALAPLMEIIKENGGEVWQNSDAYDASECDYCSGDCPCNYCTGDCQCEVCRGDFQCAYCMGNCNCDVCELTAAAAQAAERLNFWRRIFTADEPRDLYNGGFIKFLAGATIVIPDDCLDLSAGGAPGERLLRWGREHGYCGPSCQNRILAVRAATATMSALPVTLTPVAAAAATNIRYNLPTTFQRLLRAYQGCVNIQAELQQLREELRIPVGSALVCQGACTCHYEECAGECTGNCSCSSSSVDGSCGLHVHIEARDLTEAQRAVVGIIYHYYDVLHHDAHHEDRQDGGWAEARPYCALWNVHGVDTLHRVYERHINCRFKSVNLQSFRVHGTIEFRQAAACLDAPWIAAWTQVLRAVVDTVQKQYSWVTSTTTASEVTADLPATLQEFLADELPWYATCEKVLLDQYDGLWLGTGKSQHPVAWEDLCPAPVSVSEYLHGSNGHGYSLAEVLQPLLQQQEIPVAPEVAFSAPPEERIPGQWEREHVAAAIIARPECVIRGTLESLHEHLQAYLGTVSPELNLALSRAFWHARDFLGSLRNILERIGWNRADYQFAAAGDLSHARWAMLASERGCGFDAVEQAILRAEARAWLTCQPNC